MISYSVERLYHFKCSVCQKWWSIGDWDHKLVSCPFCEHCESPVEDNSQTCSIAKSYCVLRWWLGGVLLLALMFGFILGWWGTLAHSAELIGNEVKYLPVLDKEIDQYWNDLSWRSMLAAQIQQETCPSLSSKKCWSPTAELKTSREYGFGLGQLTVTDRFNNFNAAKQLHPSLKDWTWENRYQAQYQIRTLVLMNKFTYAKIKNVDNEWEHMAFSFAAYNGGLGGVLSDRTVCRITNGCDDSKWFHHVEHTSRKAKGVAHGYGKSFFQINREYVANIMGFRRTRYLQFFGEDTE